MTDPLPSVIQRYLAAYNARDVDAMLATFADDVVFMDVSNQRPPARCTGKTELAAIAKQSVEMLSTRKQTVVDAVISGDRVALLIQYEATLAKDLPNGMKAGHPIRAIGSSFYELKGGLIAKLTDVS